MAVESLFITGLTAYRYLVIGSVWLAALVYFFGGFVDLVGMAWLVRLVELVYSCVCVCVFGLVSGAGWIGLCVCVFVFG